MLMRYVDWLVVSLSYPLKCFNMLDLAPEDLHQLTEVLRTVEFHPQQCNIFGYGTSTGAVRLCDLRAAALCDRTWRALGDGQTSKADNKLTYSGPLDEYMHGVLDISFDSQSGYYLAVRDFGQVKVWDLRVEDRPLLKNAVLPRNQLLAHLYNRFEDGISLDSFRCLFIGGESLYPSNAVADVCCSWLFWCSRIVFISYCLL